jgi:3-hydroxyisobutyrate dehydrogenase
MSDSTLRPGACGQVGIVGLGNMGMAVAKTMLAAGTPLVAHDIRVEARDEIKALGADCPGSLAGLADCWMVSLLLFDDSQVDEVVNELAAHLAPGATVVIHSTVSPTTVRNAAAVLSRHDIDVLDACVSGGNFTARDADLTVMVGGSAEVLAKCRSQLEVVGRVYHMGELGNGAATKIINNLMLNGHWVLCCEALELAARLGISEERFREIVLTSSGACWSIDHLDHLDGLLTIRAANDPRFGEHFTKDPALALNIAHEVDVRIPITALVRELEPEILMRRWRTVSWRTIMDREDADSAT